jgi:hypothetical protein
MRPFAELPLARIRPLFTTPVKVGEAFGARSFNDVWSPVTRSTGILEAAVSAAEPPTVREGAETA